MTTSQCEGQNVCHKVTGDTKNIHIFITAEIANDLLQYCSRNWDGSKSSIEVELERIGYVTILPSFMGRNFIGYIFSSDDDHELMIAPATNAYTIREALGDGRDFSSFSRL